MLMFVIVYNMKVINSVSVSEIVTMVIVSNKLVESVLKMGTIFMTTTNMLIQLNTFPPMIA